MTLLLHECAGEGHAVPVANAAAGGGHLHILQWLRVQNPKFLDYSYTASFAASLGHLHILQWLQQQLSGEVGGTALASKVP